MAEWWRRVGVGKSRRRPRTPGPTGSRFGSPTEARALPRIFSNPIYVDLPAPAPPDGPPEVAEVVTVAPGTRTGGERDTASTADPASAGGSPARHVLAFALVGSSARSWRSSRRSSSPFPGSARYSSTSSPSPRRRVSAQARLADGRSRWARSIYVSATPGRQSVLSRQPPSGRAGRRAL